MTKSKGARKTKAKKGAPALRDDAVNQMALLLINGVDGDEAVRLAVNPKNRKQLTEPVARLALKEARRRITNAASFDRKEEIGLARRQLLKIFTKGLSGEKTLKEAVAARHQLNRLLGLYPEGATDEEGGTEHNLAAALAHLEPLKLAEVGTSIQELCRLAALKLMGSARGRTA